MSSTLQGLLLLLGTGVVVYAVLKPLGYQQKAVEGFAASAGRIPFADQESYIPMDVAGATTVDPTLAIPPEQDYIDAADSVRYFLKVYLPETAAAASISPDAGKDMVKRALQTLANIKAYIADPNLVRDREAIDVGVEARHMADRIRRVSIPVSRYWGPDVLSVCY